MSMRNTSSLHDAATFNVSDFSFIIKDNLTTLGRNLGNLLKANMCCFDGTICLWACI